LGEGKNLRIKHIFVTKRKRGLEIHRYPSLEKKKGKKRETRERQLGHFVDREKRGKRLTFFSSRKGKGRREPGNLRKEGRADRFHNLKIPI